MEHKTDVDVAAAREAHEKAVGLLSIRAYVYDDIQTCVYVHVCVFVLCEIVVVAVLIVENLLSLFERKEQRRLMVLLLQVSSHDNL